MFEGELIYIKSVEFELLKGPRARKVLDFLEPISNVRPYENVFSSDVEMLAESIEGVPIVNEDGQIIYLSVSGEVEHILRIYLKSHMALKEQIDHLENQQIRIRELEVANERLHKRIEALLNDNEVYLQQQKFFRDRTEEAKRREQENGTKT